MLLYFRFFFTRTAIIVRTFQTYVCYKHTQLLNFYGSSENNISYFSKYNLCSQLKQTHLDANKLPHNCFVLFCSGFNVPLEEFFTSVTERLECGAITSKVYCGWDSNNHPSSRKANALSNCATAAVQFF